MGAHAEGPRRASSRANEKCPHFERHSERPSYMACQHSPIVTVRFERLYMPSWLPLFVRAPHCGLRCMGNLLCLELTLTSIDPGPRFAPAKFAKRISPQRSPAAGPLGAAAW
jgi:hypothetical protein